jgi:hypothetical protein
MQKCVTNGLLQYSAAKNICGCQYLTSGETLVAGLNVSRSRKYLSLK